MKIPCAISHRARQLCSESDEHHARVWFCMTCKMLEQRLMPISEVLADLLADAEVTVESWPPKNVPESGAVNGPVNDDLGHVQRSTTVGVWRETVYYLVKPDITVFWSDFSEYMIDRLVKENPEFTVDFTRFDWKPSERPFDAGLVNIALRYGAPAGDGLVVAGRDLVPLDYFRDMKAILDRELTRDSANVGHAALFEQLMPGWTEGTRELDARVAEAQRATVARAERSMLKALAVPAKPELVEHWQDLGGSVPPPPPA